MKTLIKQAVIVDSRSKFHNQKVDIKIENGTITDIAKNIKAEDGFHVLEHDNLHVSEGWYGSSVWSGERVYGERETIKNGLEVAAKTGFTALALNPNTNPVIDNQALINFVQQKDQNPTTKVYPIAAMTKNSDTQILAEVF